MGFSFGPSCDCCGPGGCSVRINAIMSDAASMADSGVTVSAVVKEGSTTIATFGPDSPDAPAHQWAATVTAGTAYTVELTVEQAGGDTCTFTRAFTSPAVCTHPFSVNLFIPRVWFRFTVCGGSQVTCSDYPCAMDVSATTAGSFDWTGSTGAPPTLLSDPPCYAKFTPCGPGDYTLSGTSTIPNTTDPTLSLSIPSGVADGSASFWQQITGSAGAATVRPVSGFIWPAGCDQPVSSTIYLTSTKFGSGTLTGTPDGECGGGWEGTTSGTLLDCDGNPAVVDVAWTLGQPLGAWGLTGIVDGVCLCCVPDAYGSPRWTLRAGGTGRAYIFGVTPFPTGPCFDCSALDLSFNVAFSSWLPDPGAVNCPGTEPSCANPPNMGILSDTVTTSV